MEEKKNLLNEPQWHSTAKWHIDALGSFQKFRFYSKCLEATGGLLGRNDNTMCMCKSSERWKEKIDLEAILIIQIQDAGDSC